MRSRWVAAGGLVAVAVVGLVVVVTRQDNDEDRTDRILKVYARQVGLSEDEAREQREEALQVADVYCAVEASNLVEFMAGTTTPIEDAIAYAEAACPQRAREFKEALEPDRVCELARESARLTVGETELSQAEREQRMAEIQAELEASGPPEVREIYETLSTIEDLPPAEQQSATRELSVEIGSYLDEHC